jgi:transcriptional regulator with XRE-family HTH domain
VADPALAREIANRIRTLRRSKEISIHKLADAVAMSPGYLSEVERGHSAISGELLGKIARELGVTADYLLSGQEEQRGGVIQIPPGLSEAAKALDLTYGQTIRLLEGKESLVARRANTAEKEWSKEDWISFYNKVKLYL